MVRGESAPPPQKKKTEEGSGRMKEGKREEEQKGGENGMGREGGGGGKEDGRGSPSPQETGPISWDDEREYWKSHTTLLTFSIAALSIIQHLLNSSICTIWMYAFSI